MSFASRSQRSRHRFLRIAEGKAAPKALEGIRFNIQSIVHFLKATLRSIRANEQIRTFLSNITGGNTRCQSAFKFERIASPRMLLDNFPPMTGAAPPNRFGVVDGGKDQHGRAARGDVGGNGALPVGHTGGEGADPRRAVRDDGLASQACGARTPATRDGWAGRGRGTARAQLQIRPQGRSWPVGDRRRARDPVAIGGRGGQERGRTIPLADLIASRQPKHFLTRG